MAATTFAPTAEQHEVVEAYKTGCDIVVQAGAGTGKTSTLQLLAEADTSLRILYLAFNKSIQLEAASRFPRNVQCSTAHSIAHTAIIKNGDPGYGQRLQAGRVPFNITRGVLRFNGPAYINGKYLSLAALQRCALDAVVNFCRTTRSEVQGRDIPNIKGIDNPGQDWGPGYEQLQRLVLPAAQRAWDDIRRPDGVLRFSHDHYLKLWGDSHPHLNYDVIFFDEAQDADPIMHAVVNNQDHAQRVIVGDQNQAIYAWRGAVDAMANFEGVTLPLTESFRFGPEIADVANGFLHLLESPLRIVGVGRPGTVESLDEPDAVLCKTNSGAITTLFEQLELGRRVHYVGGSSDIKGFCFGAVDLRNGKRSSHPDLAAFATWAELEEYIEHDPHGSDLKVFVTLINEHGPEKIISAIEASVSEAFADVVISTAHKAKGREWKRVRIHQDFGLSVDKKTGEVLPPSDAYLKLSYVAVTRAKLVLDPGPLAAVLSMFGQAIKGLEDWQIAAIEELPSATAVPEDVA